MDLLSKKTKTKQKTTNKQTRRRYPANTTKDTDYADNLALHANTPALAKFLLFSQEQTAGAIALYAKANKTVEVFKTRRNNLHFRYQATKICGQVHVPQE